MSGIVGQDTFIQADTTGWNPASDGQTWHNTLGGGTYAIASNEGTLTGTTGASVQYLGVTTSADSEATVRMAVASSLNTKMGLVLRGSSDGKTHYRARLFAGNLEIVSVVANVSTVIASAAYTRVLGAFDFLTLRIVDSSLKAKAWPDDGVTGEPSSWLVTVTDASVTGAGRFGVVTTPNSTGEVTSYDNYLCTDLATSFLPLSSLVLKPDNPYGYTIGSVSDAQLMTTQCVNDMVASGAVWIRYQMDWSLIETSPGVYDWTSYDDAVGKANAAGLRIFLTIRQAPSWALTQNCSGTHYLMDPTLAAGFATVLATRYNGNHSHGTVQAIGFNEEFDNQRTAEVNPGPDAYWPCRDVVWACNVIKKVQPAIQAVHPTCLVGFPSLLGKHQLVNHVTEWVQGIYDNGCNSLIDFIPFHFYHCNYAPWLDDQSTDDYGTHDPFNPALLIPRIQAIQAVNAANGHPKKPIWLTEVGYQINANITRNPACTVSESTYAGWLQYMLDSCRQNGVSKYFVFTIGSKQNDGMSITQIDYSVTPSVTTYTQAYKTYKSYITKYPSWGSTPPTPTMRTRTTGIRIVVNSGAPIPRTRSTGIRIVVAEGLPPTPPPVPAPTSRHYPTDGFYIYEAIAPTNSATYNPRLSQIASGGFQGVLNYNNLYCTGAQLVAYINAARTAGLKVILALNEKPLWDGTADISGQYPDMTTSAGTHTGPGVVAYVVNLVKTLPGLWGYYVGESIASSNHSLLKTHADLIRSTDGTHPRLYIDGVLDAVSFAQGNSPFYDVCEVGGSDHYPTGSYDGTGSNPDNGLDKTAGYAASVQAQATLHGFDPAFVCQAFSYQRYYPPARCLPYPACAPFPSRYKMREQRDQVLGNMKPRLILVYSYFDSIADSQATSDFRDVAWAFNGFII